MNPIETLNDRNFTAEIRYDGWPECPLQGDMIRVYAKGLDHIYGVDAPETAEPRGEDECYMFSLYRYEHGATALSITPFSCSWDSGCTGWVEVDREYFEDREQAAKYVEAAINEFTAYLNGDCYMFYIEDKDGEEVDSCYGFYDLDDCKSEAESLMRWENLRHNKRQIANLGAALTTIKPAWTLYVS